MVKKRNTFSGRSNKMINIKSHKNIKAYHFTIFFLLCFNIYSVWAQDEFEKKWWNPADTEYQIIDGQAWFNQGSSIYQRFPNRAEKKIKKGVWNLSKQSAGLSIRFWTNADSIFVRYKLKNFLSFPHMPATGVSGLDLYTKSYDGKWQRCWGTYSIKASSNYTFIINENKTFYKKYGREYKLYLPLYNEVEELEIGINRAYTLSPVPVREEKPIVAYGTSIAQGACASRPGMAWTNILERKIDRTVINLGFSGKGRLDSEIIDLMSEIDAKLYILDCLPNLYPNEDDTYQLTINAVKKLKEKNPETPIILTEHVGYADAFTNQKSEDKWQFLNNDLKRAFYRLNSEGYSKIFLLTKEDIGLNQDAFVDRIHPSDYGMMQLASAYESLIRKILNEKKGSISTTNPVAQSRDVYVYDWESRHNEILKLNETNPPKICLFGDSILHFWGGEPECKIARGENSWDSIIKPMGARNFGYGYDMIENVLWRVHHDELDGYSPEKIVLMIGTNNLYSSSGNEIVEGLDHLVKSINVRQPESEIILVGILPRKGGEKKIKRINLKIAQLATFNNIQYHDFGDSFLLSNGKLNESLFTDGLHPNNEGYMVLAKKIKDICN